MDFNEVSRVLVDEFSHNHTQKIFNIGFRSGDKKIGVAILPEAAKALAESLNEAVKKYESEFGEIDTTGVTKGFTSPFKRQH